MNPDVLTTDQILARPVETRERLRTELMELISGAFPKMPEGQWKDYVSDFFRRPGRNLHRRVFLYRDEAGRLMGTAIFDHGEVLCGGRALSGIYILVRAVSPEYQASGLGRKMAVKILTELKPDLLFTTCTQSPSLHSWISLPGKGLVSGFEVYPRLERKHGKDVLVTVPSTDLGPTIDAFRQIFLGAVGGRQDSVDQAVGSLTEHLVRKGMYRERYDFDPWGKGGREDILARELGAENGDGILVLFRKRG